ncbi:MAG: flavodoxin family protein [Deltaproteobacteria bacterium]|nr:flavodoxin family protein [Deltaproteobacteria bacterium]
MNVLGIYGSPRKGGNTDQLLDKVLEGARTAGAEVSTVSVRDLKMSGCIECGGCDKTGKCVVEDDMQGVYPLLQKADIIFLASPIFFYNLTSQVKALIDRAQAMWAKQQLEQTADERKIYKRGRGYLITVGATRGKNLFEGAQMVARYFFDALNMSYEGGIFFRSLEKKTAVKENPETLQEAFNLGIKAVTP